jgi:hypothetical protein
MKKCIRFSTIAFIILAMLISTFPASAGDIKTKVTGTFYWLGEPSEDPRFRGWDTPPLDPTINHFRFDFQEFYYETDNPRLNGPGLGVTNGEYHWNADGSLAVAHLWGKGTIYADSAKTVPA